MSTSAPQAVRYCIQIAPASRSATPFGVGTTTASGTVIVSAAAPSFTTSNDDVRLTTVNGSLTIGDGGLAGEDRIDLGTGDLTLVINGAVTQPNGHIIAAGLQILGSGVVTLDDPTNNVVTLAANHDGSISYTDANALVIG